MVIGFVLFPAFKIMSYVIVQHCKYWKKEFVWAVLLRGVLFARCPIQILAKFASLVIK